MNSGDVGIVCFHEGLAHSELRKELEAQFEQAEEGGSPFVIADHRGRSGNLRTYFEKIVFWAGLPQ